MKIILKKIYYIGGTIFRGMIGFFHNVFDKCPEIKNEIESEVVGKSMEDREIKVYKFSNIQNDKKILIVGGIHGNEVGTVKMASQLINHLSLNKELSSKFETYIIPCLNLDGYINAVKNPDYCHRGKVGRFNANKVDLNRNFPTNNFQSHTEWKTGKNYAEKSDQVYAGEFAGSEPETQALMNFIKKENIENLIMLHNVGKDVIINENDEVAEKWATVYRENGFKKRYGLGTSGGASDWAKENKIHYMAIESPNRWGSNWNKQHKILIKILNQC